MSVHAAMVVAGILIAAPVLAQAPEQAAPPAQAPATPPPAAPAAPAEPPTPPPPAPPAAPVKAVAPAKAPRWRAVKRPPAKPRRDREVLPPDGTPIATSPSFSRLDDGTTRISLEVDHRVDVNEMRAAGRIVYRLRGATVVQRTNQLPLPTGFFATPVERVQLVQQGPDLDLVIELRESTEVAHRIVKTPRGIVLHVDFPRSANAQPIEAPREPPRKRIQRSEGSRRLGDDTLPDGY